MCITTELDLKFGPKNVVILIITYNEIYRCQIAVH